MNSIRSAWQAWGSPVAAALLFGLTPVVAVYLYVALACRMYPF